MRRMTPLVVAGVLALTGCTSESLTTASDTSSRAASSAAATEEPTATPSEGESVVASEEAPSEAATETDAGAAVADLGTDGDELATGDGGTDGSADDAPRAAGLATVKTGADGREVERLQAKLDALGLAPGPVDGAFGPQTEAAVTAFQRLAGLDETGRADADTVAALADFESDVRVLKPGDTGTAVKRLQRRLADGPLDPGPADGAYGTKTVQAVWALEKLAGIGVDGTWGPLDEQALERLASGELATPTAKHGKRWVEFDLSQQVMKVYDPGEPTPVLISHGSSGSGVAWQNEEHSGTSVTPAGTFVISRRIDGWRESSLDIGRLYNPLYFNGGIAFHGALSVPAYPASHGCVRLPMHIAEYLPGELPNGTPVHIVQ
jgi:peptidoglycan hydrolase-like protein with peptidoglycan-binding domain